MVGIFTKKQKRENRFYDGPHWDQIKQSFQIWFGFCMKIYISTEIKVLIKYYMHTSRRNIWQLSLSFNTPVSVACWLYMLCEARPACICKSVWIWINVYTCCCKNAKMTLGDRRMCVDDDDDAGRSSLWHKRYISESIMCVHKICVNSRTPRQIQKA